MFNRSHIWNFSSLWERMDTSLTCSFLPFPISGCPILHFFSHQKVSSVVLWMRPVFLWALAHSRACLCVMWSVGQVPLMMPTVCPRVEGMEWCFQDAVGVDCSSPEPRCIWVAVLHGDSPQINVSKNDTSESTNGISAGRALLRRSQTCRVSCFYIYVCVCVCV